MSKYKELKERVEELEEQLEGSLKDTRIFVDNRIHPFGGYFKDGHELTLAGKVEAIIRHLGIDVGVEQKSCTGPSVKVTKKKGKK
jgi:hypothetical protein